MHINRENPPAPHPLLRKKLPARNASSSRPQWAQAHSSGSVACQGHIARTCFKGYILQSNLTILWRIRNLLLLLMQLDRKNGCESSSSCSHDHTCQGAFLCQKNIGSINAITSNQFLPAWTHPAKILACSQAAWTMETLVKLWPPAPFLYHGTVTPSFTSTWAGCKTKVKLWICKVATLKTSNQGMNHIPISPLLCKALGDLVASHP